jgi:hypothetical protein
LEILLNSEEINFLAKLGFIRDKRVAARITAAFT